MADDNDIKKADGSLPYLLFAPTFKEVGAALGDYVKGVIHPWRMDHLEKIAAQTKQLVGDKQTRPLPPKTAIDFIDAASKESDGYVQTLWANLLCQYLVVGAEKRESFVRILSNLSPTEAKIFNMLYQFAISADSQEYRQDGLGMSSVMEKFNLSEEDYDVAYYNMLTVGIIRNPIKKHRWIHRFLTGENNTIHISKAGIALGNYVIKPGLAQGGES